MATLKRFEKFQRKVTDDVASVGSLLVELSCVKNFEVEEQPKGERILVCKMELDGTRTVSEVNVKSEEKYSTQLPITSTDSIFTISLYIPRLYSPDVCIGMLKIFTYCVWDCFKQSSSWAKKQPNSYFSKTNCLIVGVGNVSVKELLSQAASHRGPMSQTVNLTGGEMSSAHPLVVLKFVVQMFIE